MDEEKGEEEVEYIFEVEISEDSDPCAVVALEMWSLADYLDNIIAEIDEEEYDADFLYRVKNTLRDWSCAFAPPGEVGMEYPEGSAEIINMEAYRAIRQTCEAS